MSTEFLIDTNILIYHTKGSRITEDFVGRLISEGSFNISILTKIEFLGWNRHTPEGFEKSQRLIDSANVYHLDDDGRQGHRASEKDEHKTCRCSHRVNSTFEQS